MHMRLGFTCTLRCYTPSLFDEVCELVGLYMLHLLSRCFDQKDLGLYRDDGITAQSLTRKQADKAR